MANLKQKVSISNKLMQISTGFTKLDKFIIGLEPSDLIILASRPAMGKTSLALNTSINVAKIGYKVAIFSLEMLTQQLVNRIVSSEANINLSKLENKELGIDNKNKFNAVFENLIRNKIFLYDMGNITIKEIVSEVKRLKIKQGLDFIVIDYLQLIKGIDKESRELEILKIIKSLEELAKELDIPILLLSQLSRKVDSRENKRPLISDLREAKSILKYANKILFIYREDVYFDKNMEKSVAEIIIAKNTNGIKGKFLLKFNDKFTRFENIN